MEQLVWRVGRLLVAMLYNYIPSGGLPVLCSSDAKYLEFGIATRANDELDLARDVCYLLITGLSCVPRS